MLAPMDDKIKEAEKVARQVRRFMAMPDIATIVVYTDRGVVLWNMHTHEVYTAKDENVKAYDAIERLTESVQMLSQLEANVN